MKKQNFNKELFESFKLTNNEMLNVKGGKVGIDKDIFVPSPPPIKI